MSQQRRHTQTFTQGINQRIPPQRTDGLLRVENARLSKIGETAQVSRIAGYTVVNNTLTPPGTVVDTLVDGNRLYVLSDTGSSYTVQVRNLDDNINLIESFGGIQAEGIPSLIASGDSVYIFQAGKFIFEQDGQYYINDDIPQQSVSGKTRLDINAADDIVNVNQNAVYAPSILTVTTDGPALSRQIGVEWFDRNKARGIAGTDLGGGTNSLDRIFRLEFNGSTSTQTSLYSGTEQGIVNFNVTLPLFETSYPIRIVSYPRNFPEQSTIYEGTLFAYGTPTIDVSAQVSTVNSSNMATITITVEGQQFEGTQLNLTSEISMAGLTITSLTHTDVITSNPPPVLKARLGYEYLNFGRPYSYSYSFTMERPTNGNLVIGPPSGPSEEIVPDPGYTIQNDWTFGVNAQVQVVGQPGGLYGASDTTSFTVPSFDVGGGTKPITFATPFL